MATISTTSTITGAASCHLLLPCRSPTCPPWLLAALADIEHRVRSLAVSLPDEEETHSFAERAENYYQKRPLLLSLLQDLHHQYLYLADRYSQSLLKSHHHKIPSVDSLPDESHDDSSVFSSAASEAESSLSFQPVPQPLRQSSGGKGQLDADLVVAELVMAMVEKDLMAAEVAEAERRRSESARKIELQGSLLEVLESERMVLLGENARLGFRASAAGEEAAAMAAELGYMRRKAAELARLVVKLREEHRVCILGRKIELLQAQIYGLEKRNRDCYESMAEWEAERKRERAEMERLRAENRYLAEAAARRRKGMANWWGRVRRFEWAPCMPYTNTNTNYKKGKGGGCFCL